MFAESHIHLTQGLFDGGFPYIKGGEGGFHIAKDGTRDELIRELKEAGIAFCVEPGIERESNDRLLALAEAYPDFVYPAVGVHPTRAFDTPWKERKHIEELSGRPEVVAIGELGLDYHYERKEQHRFKQTLWFVWQLLLAHKRGLPLILHIRMADEDAIRILRLFRRKLHGGVCHCFRGDAETAKIYTQEFGLMLGIGGSLLQGEDHSAALAEAVKETPLEYLLLETDGPYVRPVRPEGIPQKAWRKARNTSLILPEIAARVAELKGITVEEVERVTMENTIRLFRISEKKG